MEICPSVTKTDDKAIEPTETIDNENFYWNIPKNFTLNVSEAEIRVKSTQYTGELCDHVRISDGTSNISVAANKHDSINNLEYLKAGWLYLRQNNPNVFRRFYRKKTTKFYGSLIMDASPKLILRRKANSRIDRYNINIPLRCYKPSTSCAAPANEIPSKFSLILQSDSGNETDLPSYEFIFNTITELNEWLSVLNQCASMNDDSRLNENTACIDKPKKNADDSIYAEPELEAIQKTVTTTTIATYANDELCVEYDIPKSSKPTNRISNNDAQNEQKPSTSSAIDSTATHLNSLHETQKCSLKILLFNRISKLYKWGNSEERNRTKSGEDGSIDKTADAQQPAGTTVTILSPCAKMPRGEKILTLINQLNENGQLVLLSRSNLGTMTPQKSIPS